MPDLRLARLHQLDPVAERVEHEDARMGLELVVVDHLRARGAAAGGEVGQPVDQKGRVRLAGRTEIVLDAEMQADAAAREPAAAAALQAPSE